MAKPRGDETFEIDNVKCVAETDAAIQCLIDGEVVWIPNSQVAENSEVLEEGDEGTLIITMWLARERSLV